MEKIVRSALTAACLLAGSPTSIVLSFAKATTDGVVRYPSLLAITVGTSPSSTATQLFVVPKSIPITLLMTIHFPIFVLAHNP